MSLKKYRTLSRYIKNWGTYFLRKSEKGQTVRFVTKGHPLTFDVPPAFYPIFREMFMEDFYAFRSVSKMLPENPVVVDVGANVGFFTFQLLAARPKAKVYAFEPMQKNVDVFRANIDLNLSITNNIQLNKKAVTGNKDGDIEIYFDSANDDTVIASVYQDFSDKNIASETVPAITLQRIISDNNLAKVDLLKLDCEGSEYGILYDSPPAIFDNIQAMIIEVHDLDEDTRNEKHLSAFLKANGYAITSHIGENGCPSFLAYK